MAGFGDGHQWWIHAAFYLHDVFGCARDFAQMRTERRAMGDLGVHDGRDGHVALPGASASIARWWNNVVSRAVPRFGWRRPEWIRSPQACRRAMA